MKKSSVFYLQKVERRFPISLMAIEVYSNWSQTSTELAEDQVVDHLSSLVKEYCFVESPTEEDIAYFLEYLKGLQEAIEGQSPPKKSRKQSFGTSYSQYLQSNPLDLTLLQMVNYDYAKAQDLYCQVDREDVLLMIGNFLRFESEKTQTLYEACLYGFGGKYKSDKGGEVISYDLDTDQGLAELAACGFGQL